MWVNVTLPFNQQSISVHVEEVHTSHSTLAAQLNSYSEFQIGCQGLALVLIRTTPHNLIMTTNTDRYLELDSTAGDKGLCLRCTLAGSRNPCVL